MSANNKALCAAAFTLIFLNICREPDIVVAVTVVLAFGLTLTGSWNVTP